MLHVYVAGLDPLELQLDLLPVEAGVGIVVVVDISGVIGFGRQDFLGHRRLPHVKRQRRVAASKNYRARVPASTDGATWTRRPCFLLHYRHDRRPPPRPTTMSSSRQDLAGSIGLLVLRVG